MTMMEEIMEKLGVERNEVFCISVNGSKLNGFRFIEKGPKDIVFEDIQNRGYDYFYDLLNGAVTIIKNPWRPKIGEDFYQIHMDGHIYSYIMFAYDKSQYDTILLGNCYRTKKEAEKYSEYWKQVYKDMPEFKEVEK